MSFNKAKNDKVNVASAAKNQTISRQSNIRGQGLTEYLIIVALIAIASIAVVSYFGQSVQGQFAGLSGSLAGTGAAEGRAVAEQAAADAVSNASTKKDLGNYYE